ncbi:MAG TPA: divalent-cation tolerance protein CutA [Candidatus Sulfopaludibacter sp.]|nr:divalent-cation tolerance protein CutA [Candidatus Sulfopaludibacter sp.]
MNGEIVILCTCSSEAEAQRIASRLLEDRLAACVNVIPSVRSYYWWQEAIESSAEYLLLIKSTAAHFPAIEEAVRENHSYEVPELLAVPVLAGSANYLTWLNGNLRPANS